MAHRAAGDVVQHHQRPWLLRALCQGTLDPAIGVIPVARDRIPQHAGVATAREEIRRFGAEQMRPKLAAATLRPEITMRAGKRSEQPLDTTDLTLDQSGFMPKPERARVRKCVIADPMTFNRRTFGQSAMFGQIF